MRPYDGYLHPLPANPETVLRGFASVTSHPSRQHPHSFYEISLPEASSNESKADTMQEPPSHYEEKKSRMDEEVVETHKTLCFDSINIPENWYPRSNVDANDPNAMLQALPGGIKQPYNVWISLFFAFSRSGVTYEAFWERQPRSSRKSYWESNWNIRKKDNRGYGLNFIRRFLKHIGVKFLA